jgi:hypothetical protein
MSLDKALYNFARRGILPSMPAMIGSSPIGIDDTGKLIKTGVGREFYVAGNWGADTNTGLSWDQAYLTLAQAIDANNTDVAADKYGWATRNRIYLSADTTTETLVAFPNKCDVIGVGSYDANDKPGITGNHAPVNTGNYGTRFFDIWFKGVAAAAPMIDLVSSTSGCQLIRCTLDGSVGTLTYGVRATASPFLRLIDCEISGPFATGYVTFGTGETASTLIDGCLMSGTAGLGISSVTGTTASYASVIRNTTIITTSTGLCIDDDANGSAGIFYIFDVRCKNGATLTNYAGRTGILDINEKRALNVQYVGADVAGYIPLWTLT